MSVKRGMTLSQILLILMITGIFITLTVSSWNPAKDEYGNVINTKSGTYANELDFSGETEAFYNSPVARELGSVELKGQTMDDINLKLASVYDEKKFFKDFYDPDDDGYADDVIVSFDMATMGASPTKIEVDELDKYKLFKDDYYIVIEEETR